MIHEIFLVLMLMLLWFNTNVIYEYFGWLPMFKGYKTCLSEGQNYSFEEYLMLEKDNFFSKLVSCPYCFGFWLSVFACVSFGSLLNLPIVYIGSLFGYKLFSLVEGYQK